MNLCKVRPLLFPALIITLGVSFIVTKKGVYEGVEAEGVAVVGVGVVLCLLGAWGIGDAISRADKNDPPNDQDG